MPVEHRKPATVCPCGWIHKHGVEPTCALALAALRRQEEEQQEQPKPSSRRQPRRPATADARSAYARRKRRPEYRWSVLKSQAKQRRLVCDLPFAFFDELIRRPCHYCGVQAKKFRGVDRVDNDLGYIRENVVACCSTCNYMKGGLEREQFLAHVRRVHRHARSCRADSHDSHAAASECTEAAPHEIREGMASALTSILTRGGDERSVYQHPPRHASAARTSTPSASSTAKASSTRGEGVTNVAEVATFHEELGSYSKHQMQYMVYERDAAGRARTSRGGCIR